jgi:ABC-type transport system involved in multi-copper enzyme maturation permease subunit
MIFLPIVERELRVAARRPGTYWARFQSALAALVPAGFLLAGPVPFASRTQQGAQMFQILTFLAFIYALLAAVRLTADCLSAEKREGTLGLLFLTDLKPRDVVFGKLAATSCNALYGLWALIPVLAIPLLLGGVTLADVLRLALVLGNTLFFALALALFVSALCWHEKKAVGMATLLLFASGAVLPLAGSFVAAINGRSGVASLLALASPGMACALVPERAYGAAPGAFWISTASTHALGWMFLALTCRVLPRVWQDRPAEGRRRRWREWRRDLLLGRATARAAFRRRLLAVNPVFWLASRERRAAWGPWLLLGSVGAIGAWACWKLGIRSVDPGALMFCSYGLNCFFKYWLATEAGHTFSTDRDKGALELLLCTPLNMRDVLRGHWLGLRRQFLAPVLTLLVVELILFRLALQSDALGGRFDVALFSTMFLGSALVFVADLFALVWTGWWAGVVSKNASSAVSTTYFRLMILPWMAVAVGLVLSYLAFNFTEEGYVATGLLTWIGTSLAVDWFFARRARRRLLTELRGAAVERYSGGDPAMRWWRWLGRRLAERRTRPSSRPGCAVPR